MLNSLVKNTIKMQIQITILFLAILYGVRSQIDAESIKTDTINDSPNKHSHQNVNTTTQLEQDSQSKTSFKIYDQQYNKIYPFSKKQINQLFQCGVIHSLQYKAQQQFIITLDQPFIVLVSTDYWSDFRILGYAESKPLDSSIQQKLQEATDENKQSNNKYYAIMTVNRTCISNFTAFYFNTVFDVYHQPSQNFDFSSNQFQITGGSQLIFSHRLSSVTECADAQQIAYMQRVFNAFYLEMAIIIISCIPIFPISMKMHIPIFASLAVNILGYESHMFSLIVLNYTLYFLIIYGERRYYYDISFNHGKDLKLTVRSFFSITAFYDFLTILIIILYFKTGFSEKLNNDSYNGDINIFFKMALYMQNFTLILGAFHMFAQTVWLNRVKHVVWWMAMIWLIMKVLPLFAGTFLDNYSQLLEKSRVQSTMSSFITLFCPPILSAGCQRQPLLFMLLIFPICIYLGKLTTNASLGTLMMMICCVIDYRTAYWIIWGILIVSWLIEISCSSGIVNGIRRTWVDRNTLRLIA